MAHVWMMLLVMFHVGWAAPPQYSDSYLAASLQVLMNLLDQLEFHKNASAEVSATTEASSSKPDEPGPVKASFRNFDGGKGITLLIFDAREEVSASESPAAEESEAKKRLMDLYVVLSGEAKRQGVGNTQGFSDQMLSKLEKISDDSAAGQLSSILKEVLNGGEAKREASRHLVMEMISMLDDQSSSVSVALMKLQPLPYRQ